MVKLQGIEQRELGWGKSEGPGVPELRGAEQELELVGGGPRAMDTQHQR